jgi:hypothetical protein
MAKMPSNASATCEKVASTCRGPSPALVLLVPRALSPVGGAPRSAISPTRPLTDGPGEGIFHTFSVAPASCRPQSESVRGDGLLRAAGTAALLARMRDERLVSSLTLSLTMHVTL